MEPLKASKRDVILCIGTKHDPHIKAVENKIKLLDSDLKVVLFNPLCIGHYIDITLSNKTTSRCYITSEDHRINAQSIRAVWYRWKPEKFRFGDSMFDTIAKDFALEEWSVVIQSLESFISHAVWLNPLPCLERVRSKAFQLQLAIESGLKIPMTNITNDSAAVQSLFDTSDENSNPMRVISKTLTPLFVPPDKLVHTSEISREFALETSSRISICPGIFQELIIRKSDLRIVVVGETTFAARITTSKELEKVDKLDQENKSLYTMGEVPESIRESLIQFHRKAGLAFGIYDFLETESELLFLECNPHGSWLWLEDIVGLEISDAVAKYLIGAQENTQQAPCKEN